MTNRASTIGKSNKIIFYFVLTAFTVFLLLFYSDKIAESIRCGIRLAAFSVVPSVFPFIVFADFLSANISDVPLGNKISSIFSIPRGTEGALLCGMICGFPCGVKYAVRLYENKMITKGQLERLIGLVNNPSLAFVISGVGVGMLRSLNDGLILFFSVIISVLFVAKFFLEKTVENDFCANISEQNYNFAKSIKDAGFSSIIISSYIVFFSAILGVVKEVVSSDIVLSFIASLLEIGNAVASINSLILNDCILFLLFGFALGFSGISVHLQAFDILPEGTSKRKYLIMKAVQGVFCGIIATGLKYIELLI